MKIKYLGHSCFLFCGQQFSLLIDPFKDIGYSLERVDCDFCICSHGHFDHNSYESCNYKHLINQNDKYSWLTTVTAYHDDKQGLLRGKNNINIFEIDGIKICHLGDLGQTESVDLVNKIKDCDLLLIPIGGKYTIDFMQAKWYVDRVNCKVVIPMHYKTKYSNLDIMGKSEFLNLFNNIKKVESEFEITKAQIDELNQKIILNVNYVCKNIK